jgi:hypothetical protein
VKWKWRNQAFRVQVFEWFCAAEIDKRHIEGSSCHRMDLFWRYRLLSASSENVSTSSLLRDKQRYDRGESSPVGLEFGLRIVFR